MSGQIGFTSKNLKVKPRIRREIKEYLIFDYGSGRGLEGKEGREISFDISYKNRRILMGGYDDDPEHFL